MTAAPAPAGELLAAQKAALKLLSNCVIILSSALCSPVVFLNYPLSHRRPSSSPAKQSALTRGEAQKCLFSDSVPSSPSSQPPPRMHKSVYILTLHSMNLHSTCRQAAEGFAEQGTGHYSTPEGFLMPSPVTTHPLAAQSPTNLK